VGGRGQDGVRRCRCQQKTAGAYRRLLSDLFVFEAVPAWIPEAELSSLRPRLHHLREKDGRSEIDRLVELAGGDVIALEIKATAAPAGIDARHLAWLRDRLGPRFVAGAVLQSGPRPFGLGNRIFALPICSLAELKTELVPGLQIGQTTALVGDL